MTDIVERLREKIERRLHQDHCSMWTADGGPCQACKAKAKDILVLLDEPEIKPCPFCGGRNIEVHTYENGRGGGYLPWIAVYCNDCDIQGESQKTEDEAIESWNRRTHSPDQP